MREINRLGGYIAACQIAQLRGKCRHREVMADISVIHRHVPRHFLEFTFAGSSAIRFLHLRFPCASGQKKGVGGFFAAMKYECEAVRK